MLGKESAGATTKPAKEKKEKLPKEPKVQLTKEEKALQKAAQMAAKQEKKPNA